MPIDSLMSPFALGELALANRFVMAPLTRNRAAMGEVPGPFAAEYYAQRAGAGLIITEGTQPSRQGRGYINSPGLHTEAQIEGWRAVADAVHERGGHIFAQILHCGRVSHSVLGEAGSPPVAPSAVRVGGGLKVRLGELGRVDFEEPRELAREELPGICDDFAQAARNAVRAGLDGVELHAANGYLLHQFLATGTNRRTDEYGGSPERRVRFVVEVATASVAAIGRGRVGIRLSPHTMLNDLQDEEGRETFVALLRALQPLGLAYVHVIEPLPECAWSAVDVAREWHHGALIANAGFGNTWTMDEANQVLEDGRADLISFGRRFLANPDLVERVRVGAELNEPDRRTYYGGGAEGYTDYPTMQSASR